MMTAQQLKFLKGLIAFHRDTMHYWDSKDVIDFDKREAYNHYLELRYWLHDHSYCDKDADDILDMLKELSE